MAGLTSVFIACVKVGTRGACKALVTRDSMIGTPRIYAHDSERGSEGARERGSEGAREESKVIL